MTPLVFQPKPAPFAWARGLASPLNNLNGSAKNKFINVRQKNISRLTPFGDKAGLDRMAQLGMGYRGFRALLLAVELRVFDVLEAAGGKPDALSKRLRIYLPLLCQLLNILSALGFLNKKNDRFTHTHFSKDWLRETGKKTMVKNLKFQAFLGQAYADLAETYKKGHPQQSLGRLLSRNKKFLTDYIHGMAEIAAPSAKDLARATDLRGVRRMLDVGGGHGLFSLAMLKKNHAMHADILDLPTTLEITRDFVSRSPQRNRVSLVKGDYLSADFGRKSYDLILFSHVMHDEDSATNIQLLQKARKALSVGGRILIHDFFVDEEGTSPLFSLLLGFQLTSYTMAGRCYSVKDIIVWLKETGFRFLRSSIINPGLPSRTMAFLGRAT